MKNEINQLTVPKKIAVLCFSVLMFLCVVFGNLKIVSSYKDYSKNVQSLKTMNIEGIDRYFKTNEIMTKEKALEFVKIASKRDLEQAYFRPWYYFSILMFNLIFALVAYLLYLEVRIRTCRCIKDH